MVNCVGLEKFSKDLLLLRKGSALILVMRYKDMPCLVTFLSGPVFSCRAHVVVRYSISFGTIINDLYFHIRISVSLADVG